MSSTRDSKSFKDLKHITMQKDDKDTIIHIDTKQFEHYSHLLYNFIDNLEAKSLTNIKDFIILLESTPLKHSPIESTLKYSRHILQLKEEKIANDNHIKLSKIKNTKMRTEIVTALRFQKKELNESILLIKKMITTQKRKRRLFLITPMIGIAIFMIYKYCQFSNNHKERYYSLENELSELTKHMNPTFQSHPLGCAKTNGKSPESFTCILNISNFLESFFKDKCISPYMSTYMPVMPIINYGACRHHCH